MTWPTKKLGEVCNIVYGFAFKANAFNETDKGLPVIRIGDVDKGETNKFFDGKYDDKYLIQKGDILLGLSGSFKAARWEGDTALLNQRVATLKNFENKTTESFVFYQMPRLFVQFEKTITQLSVKNILTKHLENLKVLYCPLKIQKKIVERLDKIAEAQKLNDELIQKADELFQSLLHKELNPAGKNWEVKKLGDIIKPQYGYTASAKDSGEYRFIRITDISDKGELRDSDDKKYVTLSQNEAENYQLRNGDLLLARTGATFGKILYFKENEPSIFASFLIRLNQDASIDPFYIWLFSRSQGYWRQAKSLMTGSGQPQFNANKLKQIKIPLPPLKIQKQIVEKLSAVQEYKKNLTEQRVKLKELFDSALHKSLKNPSTRA